MCMEVGCVTINMLKGGKLNILAGEKYFPANYSFCPENIYIYNDYIFSIKDLSDEEIANDPSINKEYKKNNKYSIITMKRYYNTFIVEGSVVEIIEKVQEMIKFTAEIEKEIEEERIKELEKAKKAREKAEKERQKAREKEEKERKKKLAMKRKRDKEIRRKREMTGNMVDVSSRDIMESYEEFIRTCTEF